MNYSLSKAIHARLKIKINKNAYIVYQRPYWIVISTGRPVRSIVFSL